MNEEGRAARRALLSMHCCAQTRLFIVNIGSSLYISVIVPRINIMSRHFIEHSVDALSLAIRLRLV